MGTCDDLLSVLASQLDKTFISFNGFLIIGQLVSRDVSRVVFSILPALTVVVGTVWALTKDADLAANHALNLADFIQDLYWSRV